jgi:hypothetical protein
LCHNKYDGETEKRSAVTHGAIFTAKHEPESLAHVIDCGTYRGCEKVVNGRVQRCTISFSSAFGGKANAKFQYCGRVQSGSSLFVSI